MWRWSVSLAVLLGLMTTVLGASFWLMRVTSEKAEDVRLVRAQHQQLEQQLALLQSPDTAPLILTLREDLDALQIRLVEVVTLKPLPTGVLNARYAQTILPQLIDGAAGDLISVLRLELTLTVLHASGLLEMLERINGTVSGWPHETRACELQRLPQQILSAQCVVDFYHWSDSHDIESAQAARLETGLST